MATIDELLAAAMAVRLNAYAPYSGFAVGAALLTTAGRLYTGANVENAAYPLGLCAEAAAIAAMVGDGGRTIAEIAIIGGPLDTTRPAPALTPPCGGCRQRIGEFSGSDTLIHICGLSGLRSTYTLDQLLPHAFGPETLSSHR